METKQKSRVQIIKEIWRLLGPTAKDLLLDKKTYRLFLRWLRSLSDKSLDNFWPRFRFEKWLTDNSKKHEARDESEKSALKAIQDALNDLKKVPSLFSGDPFGDFTYDHPILAIAITRFRTCLDPENRLLFRSDGSLNNAAVFKWVKTGVSAYLKYGSKSIKELRKRVPEEPLKLQDDAIVRIAVAGDAGFPNTAQENLIRKINALNKTKPFNLFIHLGDTYFAGSDREFLHNLLVPFHAVKFEKVALCGNHDLYQGGTGFGAVITMWDQPGRYLAVETKSWIIACLDTAQGAQDRYRMKGKLDDKQFQWLEGLIKNKGEKRIILMSHHSPITAWSKSKKKTLLMTQLEKLSSDIFAWYWGHEHVCAAYPPATRGFYGACVGNGVFQEKWSKPSKKTPHPTEWYSEARCKCLRDPLPFVKRHFWPHGLLELELHSDKIIETYHVEGEKHPYIRTLPIP